MIHSVEVTDATSVEEFRKLFRKKLMTGGAKARIRAGLSNSQLESIYLTFSPEAEENNAAMSVLIALAEHKDLPESLERKLFSYSSRPLQRALQSRRNSF